MNSLNTLTYLPNKPDVKDKMRIFCFPYAGGGVKSFREWSGVLPESINVYPVQYPGRENRMSEKPIDDFDFLCKSIYSELRTHFDDDIPYILYGHSLGTKVAYEIAKKAEQDHVQAPQKVIVSAGRAPHLTEPKPIYNLSDDDFIESLRRFSGTPEAVLQNRELMSVFLPMLRADFKLDETYQLEEIEPLQAPILGLMGSKDQEMTLEDLKAWEVFTVSDFQYEIIEGPHLFIDTNLFDVISIIQKHLGI